MLETFTESFVEEEEPTTDTNGDPPPKVREFQKTVLATQLCLSFPWKYSAVIFPPPGPETSVDPDQGDQPKRDHMPSWPQGSYPPTVLKTVWS